MNSFFSTLNKPYIRLFIKLLIVLLIIYYLVTTKKLNLIILGHALSDINVLYGFLLLAILPLIFSIRWMLLLENQSIFIPFFKLFKLTSIALFFDTILPPGGADIIRGYFLNKSHPLLDNRVFAFSSIFMDRIIGLLGLLFLAVLGFFLNLHFLIDNNIIGSTAIFLTVTSTSFLTVFILVLIIIRFKTKILQFFTNKAIFDTLNQGFASLNNYHQNLKDVSYVFILSIFCHLLTFISILLLGSTVGEIQLSFVNYLGLLPLSFLFSQLPIGPGFIGLGFLIFYSAFKIAGSNYGGDIFGLYLVVRILSTLPGAFFYIFFNRSK